MLASETRSSSRESSPTECTATYQSPRPAAPGGTAWFAQRSERARLTILTKSSEKPIAAQPMPTPKNREALGVAVRRTDIGTEIARKMISPPIVGVPAFSWCSSGPSRGCAGRTLEPQVVDELRPEEDRYQHRRHPGDQDFTHGGPPRPSRGRRHASPDEDASPFAQALAEGFGGRGGVGDRHVGLVSPAPGRRPRSPAPRGGPGVLADLAVVSLGVVAELAHLRPARRSACRRTFSEPR